LLPTTTFDFCPVLRKKNAKIRICRLLFFASPHHKTRMEVVSFRVFAQTQKDYTGPDSVVDVCLHAMEEGILTVFAKQMGYLFLWELCIMTPGQWARTCALVEHHRLPSRLCWRFPTGVYCTWDTTLETSCLVSHVPDAMAALTRIEFLWQDLDAVEAYISIKSLTSTIDIEWVAVEVARRRQWFAGLRRAWLLTASG
jgi:hypothetical protein